MIIDIIILFQACERNKKEQEREELHRAIWVIADELRGAVENRPQLEDIFRIPCGHQKHLNSDRMLNAEIAEINRRINY